MKLDLSIQFDRNKAKARFDKLMEKQAKIDLKEHAQRRTLNQNAYAHVCFGILGDYAGYTIDEIKIIIKDQLDWMTYTKNGHKFYRSTADLNKQEYIDLVDYIRSFGDQHGVYLPTPEEYIESRFELERQINHMT